MSSPAPGRHYFDSSAFVKLFVDEPESAAVRAQVGEIVSSDLIAIEVRRTARRLGGRAPALAEGAMSRVRLIPIGLEIRDQAGSIGPPVMRSLDAIHLATAHLVRESIDAVVTYDRRLTEAAEALGLPVLSPA